MHPRDYRSCKDKCASWPKLSAPQLQNAARVRASQQQQLTVFNSDNDNIDERIDRATKEKDSQVRDALLNRIAHSLMRSDSHKALEVAGKINEAEIRAQTEDDIRLVVIQRLLVSSSYEDARNTALKLRNPLLQVKVLVELANKVWSQNKDTGRATELLSEASEIISKTEPVPDKVVALLLIAQQFVRFDPIRGFEALGNAIKTVNQLRPEEPAESVLSKPRILKIKSYTVLNGNEVSPSDRATFDSIDFNQVEPFVSHDYMQTKLLGNKLDRALPRAKFMTAVARAMLDSFEKRKLPPKNTKIGT